MHEFNSTQNFWSKESILLHSEKLKAWLAKKFPDERDVDDIVQESLKKTFVADERRPLLSPKSYLFATARNQAINGSKRSKIRGEKDLVQTMTLDVLVDGNSDVFEKVAVRQENEILKDAINSLPEKCRKIFELRIFEGLSQQEIARELNLSVNTVYAQLSIGLHKCGDFVARHRIKGLS